MKGLFDKIGSAALAASVAASSAVADIANPSFDENTINDIKDGVKTGATGAVDIIIIIAVVIGMVVFLMGVYDLFAADDTRGEGKNKKGVMKIIGGIVLGGGALIYKAMLSI